MLVCVFLLEWIFTQKKSTTRSMFATAIAICPPPTNPTMSSLVVTVKEGMDIHNQTKTKIEVGAVVKSKVGELENITREVRSIRMKKEVVGCVQSVVGRKNFLVQFEDVQKKEIIFSSLVFLSLKEEVDMDEPISHLPEKRTRRIVDY